MAWFIKTETFTVPYEQMIPHLAAHRLWVKQCKQRGETMSSGYLVDGQGRPGGGGLLLLQASDHGAAEALVRQDPMVKSGLVNWTLQGWIPSVGDLAVVDLPGAESAQKKQPPTSDLP